MIRFFTLAWNAMPFIRHHLPVFQSLTVPWQWRIAYGPSATFSGRPAPSVPDDGTGDYLASIHDARVEVIASPADSYLTHRCAMMLEDFDGGLAWQVDADEFWTREQIETMCAMFADDPVRQAAWFYCRFFVGPRLCLEVRPGAGNITMQEWKRVWRWRRGCRYVQHDPPMVAVDNIRDLSYVRPFRHDETAARGLVFDHHAFVCEHQVAFKAARYGWANAVRSWHMLQESEPPVSLSGYLPWLGEGVVTRA